MYLSPDITCSCTESHDIALALQHKIESLEEVERAFVHVDYLTRDGLEHKVERELVMKAEGVKTHAAFDSPAQDSAGQSDSDVENNAEVNDSSFGLRSRTKAGVGLENSPSALILNNLVS